MADDFDGFTPVPEETPPQDAAAADTPSGEPVGPADLPVPDNAPALADEAVASPDERATGDEAPAEAPAPADSSGHPAPADGADGDSGAPSDSADATAASADASRTDSPGVADDAVAPVMVGAAAPPPVAVAGSSDRSVAAGFSANRIVALGLLAIVALVGLAIAGTLLLASDPDAIVATPTANPTATAAPTSATLATATTETIVAAPSPTSGPAATSTTAGTFTPEPYRTPTPAGNAELDGTIVDAIRMSAASTDPPDFTAGAPLLAIVDDLPAGASAGLIQRLESDGESTFIVRYYLMADASAARELARLEAGIPTQYEGALTVDDREIAGGACVTVTVLEEMISHCYVLRGRVAMIVEILGPATARDTIIDAGVALAAYGRQILARAITD